MDKKTTRALVIEDDPIIRKIASSILNRLGIEVTTADDGLEGMKIVKITKPDVVITDVMMPGLDGYEVTRQLRRDPQYSFVPILILTAQSGLEDKLKAFEAGADDYMSKPFEPAELAARVVKLLRWKEAAHVVERPEGLLTEKARIIAVHSLRGGVGCSSLAVNLSTGLAGLWAGSTLLLDTVMTAGQIALMMNIPLKRTWADLARYEPSEVDFDLLKTLVSKHESGLDVIAAPTFPEEAEKLTGAVFSETLKLLQPHYEYIVADVAHNFGDIALQVLDEADIILLMLAPEMSSVRAAVAALDTYSKLGYPDEKIKLILNWTFQHNGLARKAIENALHFPFDLVLPFAPDRFIPALNLGKPLLFEQPNDPVSSLIEDLSFRLSKERHQTTPPAAPGPAWLRVNQRLTAMRDGKHKN